MAGDAAQVDPGRAEAPVPADHRGGRQQAPGGDHAAGQCIAFARPEVRARALRRRRSAAEPDRYRADGLRQDRRLADAGPRRQPGSAAARACDRRGRRQARHPDGRRAHRGCQHHGGGLAAWGAVHPGLFRARARRGGTQVVTASRRRALSACAAYLIAGCSSVESPAPSPGSSPGSSPTPAITVGSALAGVQILARGLDDTPRSIDPQLATDVPGQRVLDDLFEGLTTIDVAGKASAGVASSWESSADGKTWMFHLRPNARWSNGAPVMAGDFVYSWRRMVDPRTGAEYAQGLAAIDNALEIAAGKKPTDTLGVEALDGHTLRVRLSGPTPYLLDLLAQQYMYPVYEPAITQYGDASVRPEHLVCNGAFVLRENVLGSRITLEKNDKYWGAAHVRLQRVVYYIL